MLGFPLRRALGLTLTLSHSSLWQSQRWLGKEAAARVAPGSASVCWLAMLCINWLAETMWVWTQSSVTVLKTHLKGSPIITGSINEKGYKNTFGLLSSINSCISPLDCSLAQIWRWLEASKVIGSRFKLARVEGPHRLIWIIRHLDKISVVIWQMDHWTFLGFYSSNFATFDSWWCMQSVLLG